MVNIHPDFSCMFIFFPCSSFLPAFQCFHQWSFHFGLKKGFLLFPSMWVMNSLFWSESISFFFSLLRISIRQQIVGIFPYFFFFPCSLKISSHYLQASYVSVETLATILLLSLFLWKAPEIPWYGCFFVGSVCGTSSTLDLVYFHLFGRFSALIFLSITFTLFSFFLLGFQLYVNSTFYHVLYVFNTSKNVVFIISLPVIQLGYFILT